uniref:Aldo_ket_red domain-containing protein n=1 Tax=Syphacia muris TaxID=451379 RepID=A0A0N5AEN6_9BILA
MYYTKLNNGVQMPCIGLGTWNSEPGQVGAAVKVALNAGYRLLDCALCYENQPEVGEALKSVFSEGKIQRKDVFITTKIWNTYHSYERAKKSIDDMLKEMQLDYFDLVLIHWPQGYREGGEMFPGAPDGVHMLMSDVDYLETWKAMEEAYEAKKIRAIGVSNFNHNQIQRIINNSKVKPAVLQVEIHPYFQQRKLRAFCKEKGIAVTAYSSLGNPGMPCFRKKEDPNILEDPVLKKIGAAHSKTSAQVALRWALQNNINIIPKSVTEKRILENFNIFDFNLTVHEMKEMDRLDRNWRIVSVTRDSSHEHFPFNDEF